MLAYLLKRILVLIPTFFGITLLTYMAICLAPGGPAAGIMGDMNPKFSPEYKKQQIEYFKFDKPFHVQYLNWLKNVVRLDFGVSRKDNLPVTKKIFERLPKTLILTVSAVILTFMIALPLGMVSALKQNSFIDRFITVFVFFGFSIPFYWVALLAMIFFGIHLGWLPITGFESILADDLSFPARVWDRFRHLVLPVVMIALTGLVSLTRYVRYGMLEVLKQDYIRAARAKGLSEFRVNYVHALRNTLIPLVTILALTLPDLISAGVIIETIFSYPGLGRLTYEAIMTRDVFLIMGAVTVGAALTLIANMIADLVYAAVDPRIRVR